MYGRKNGGPVACSNDARVRRVELEKKLIGLIRDELLIAEAVTLATSEFRRVLRDARKSTPARHRSGHRWKGSGNQEPRSLLRKGVLPPNVAHAVITRAEQERSSLVAASEQRRAHSADRIVRIAPDDARQYIKMIEGLPNPGLPPDELARARGLLQRFIGRPATSDRGSDGRVQARFEYDGRPLFGAAADYLVAGAGFCAYRLAVELR